MVDATSVNILLTLPANNADIGAWDVPVNNNAKALDGLLGGFASVALTNANVTLTVPTGTTTPGAGPVQVQNSLIKCTGTLTGNVTITFSVPGHWRVQNKCTGAFYVQLSGGAGNKIGAPPGRTVHVWSDGTDMDYVNPPEPGSYLDLAVGATPLWMNACTVAPYLICDGTVYNIATYPTLGGMLGATFGGNGSTTFGVPDLRGRARYAKDNQGGSAANRITVAGGNFDGTTLGNSGGAQNQTLITANLASHTHAVSITDPGHVHNVKYNTSGVAGGGGQVLISINGTGSVTGVGGAINATTSISAAAAAAGSGTAFSLLNPALIAGLTLIKT